jgi:hypothetical protein
VIVRPDLLGDLLADPVHRIQRGHRVLEDHGDPGAADLADLLRVQRHHVVALEKHLALETRVRVVDQPHHRHHGHALAGTGLADDTESLARGQGERHVIDRPDQPVLGAEGDREIAHLEQRFPGHAGRILGSSQA